MSKVTKSSGPETQPPYLLLGLLVVAVVVVAIVVMLIITGGDISETAVPMVLSPSAIEGKTLYLQNNCNTCHPAEGRAGGVGPRLSTTSLGDDAIRTTIGKGRAAMPAYPQYSDAQLNQLIAYIRALKPA